MKDQLQALLKALGKRPKAAAVEGSVVRAILSTGLFDSQWYAAQRPNLPDALDLALSHFLELGWKAGLDPSPRFSTRGYLAANPEVASQGVNPLIHYLTAGRFQGRAPGFERDGTNLEIVAKTILAEFDSAYYARNNRDASRGGYSPLAHFLSVGWKDGRDPHPQFSVKHYLDANADVRSAGINPYFHYLIAGRREGRTPNADIARDADLVAIRAVVGREFDAAYYISKYDVVRESGLDALTHYIQKGWKAGLDPNAEFSVAYYLSVHADVRDAGIDPFYHYLSEGRREGRATSGAAKTEDRATEDDVRNAIASAFDADFYLAQYPDVARAGVDPISHYLRHGWHERRDPHPSFSTSYYLSAYPDIREAGINPFYHFLITGRAEGRLPTHPGGWKVKVLQNLPSVSTRRSMAFVVEPGADAGKTAIAQLKETLAQASTRFVVSFSQDDYTTSVGGVQLCIKLEAAAARETGRHHLNLHPARAIQLLSQVTDPKTFEFCATLDGVALGVVTADKVISVLSGARRAGASCELIVHSLLGHSPEVLISLHSAAAPARSLFWLHDYFSVCPSYTLLRNDITYCGAPAADSASCSVCVFGEERRTHLARLHEAFSRISFETVSPSDFTRDLWLKSADLPHKSAVVLPHCEIEWTDDVAPVIEERPARIAFIGHPANHKGWQTFVRLVDEFGADERYEFHHFGSGNRQHAKAKFTKASVIDDGPLAMRDALARLEIDAVLMWSIWPETFSFVAHEALAAGAMLLAREEAGNVAALARDPAFGFVFKGDQALIETLRGESLHAHLVQRRQQGLRRGTPAFGRMSLDLLAPEPEAAR